MPKKENSQKQENQIFSKEEWLQKAMEKVMSEPWGVAVLKDAGAVRLELVRIGETENIMLRLAGQKPGNALKLTRQEHIDALIEIAEAIIANKNNLQDKLEAIREKLPSSRRRTEEEI